MEVLFIKEAAIKLATGMDYQYLKSRQELSKSKPEPIQLKDPIHRTKVEGLKVPRVATKRPAMMATKSTAPLNLGGNPRVGLGLKRNQ